MYHPELDVPDIHMALRQAQSKTLEDVPKGARKYWAEELTKLCNAVAEDPEDVHAIALLYDGAGRGTNTVVSH